MEDCRCVSRYHPSRSRAVGRGERGADVSRAFGSAYGRPDRATYVCADAQTVVRADAAPLEAADAASDFEADATAHSPSDVAAHAQPDFRAHASADHAPDAAAQREAEREADITPDAAAERPADGTSVGETYTETYERIAAPDLIRDASADLFVATPDLSSGRAHAGRLVQVPAARSTGRVPC